MKKIKVIIIVMLTTLGCRAQLVQKDVILPIENYIDYIDAGNGIPEDVSYIKDVNNLLDKYVGSWKGIYEGANYEFRIIKVLEPRTSVSIKRDNLLMRYKVTKGNTVIENTLNQPDDGPFIIDGLYLAKTGSYVLIYVGKEAECGQTGSVYISVGWNNDINTMKLFMYPDSDIIDGDFCTNPGYAKVLPEEQITLIKQ